jgi:hypothetical protein
MKIGEIITEDISRRGFLKGLGAAAVAGAAGLGGAKSAKADSSLSSDDRFSLTQNIGTFQRAAEVGLISKEESSNFIQRTLNILMTAGYNVDNRIVNSGYDNASRAPKGTLMAFLESAKRRLARVESSMNTTPTQPATQQATNDRQSRTNSRYEEDTNKLVAAKRNFALATANLIAAGRLNLLDPTELNDIDKQIRTEFLLPQEMIKEYDQKIKNAENELSRIADPKDKSKATNWIESKTKFWSSQIELLSAEMDSYNSKYASRK